MTVGGKRVGIGGGSWEAEKFRAWNRRGGAASLVKIRPKGESVKKGGKTPLPSNIWGGWGLASQKKKQLFAGGREYDRNHNNLGGEEREKQKQARRRYFTRSDESIRK